MSLLALARALPHVASPVAAAGCGLLAWRWRRASRMAQERAVQQRAAAERHEHQSALLSVVLDQLPGRVLVTDPDGALLYANAAVRAEPVGPALYELDGETPLEPRALPLARALAGETVTDAEVVCVRPGAPAPRRLLCSAAPVRDVRGAVLGAVNIATDVTERREAEMRLAEVNLVLRAVRAASRDIAEEGDVAQAICQATRLASGASVVLLFQPDAGGQLAITGAAGRDAEEPVGLPGHGDAPTAAARVFASGEPLFAADASAHPGLCAEWAARLGVASAVVHPIVGRATIGVLAVGWREPVEASSAPAAMGIPLLADEAALALERADLVAQLRERSLADPLTDLPNRRAWDEELDRELSRARRSGQPLCIALIDLDHFKAYNDGHGHQRGDELLRGAAAAWSAALRETDVMARWGGEEFAVCLPNCSPPEAQTVLGRLQSLTPDGQTCSVGLATWDGNEAPPELLARADRALYRAKDAGRDRVICV